MLIEVTALGATATRKLELAFVSWDFIYISVRCDVDCVTALGATANAVCV